MLCSHGGDGDPWLTCANHSFPVKHKRESSLHYNWGTKTISRQLIKEKNVEMKDAAVAKQYAGTHAWE